MCQGTQKHNLILNVRGKHKLVTSALLSSYKHYIALQVDVVAVIYMEMFDIVQFVQALWSIYQGLLIKYRSEIFIQNVKPFSTKYKTKVWSFPLVNKQIHLKCSLKILDYHSAPSLFISFDVIIIAHFHFENKKNSLQKVLNKHFRCEI